MTATDWANVLGIMGVLFILIVLGGASVIGPMVDRDPWLRGWDDDRENRP